ncbi:MAG: electron transfer flavoprotein subunit alpha/FixB family protein [Deltaproteobacteria bacterium]
MAGVWIMAEGLEPGLELINIGQTLAGSMKSTLTVITWQGELGQEFIACGADEILLLPSLGSDQPLQSYIPVIVEHARKDMPEIFLMTSSLLGKEMAARIAGQLDAGLGSECNALRWIEAESTLEMDRLFYGGAAVQTVRCSSAPRMATVAPRSFSPASPQEGRHGSVTDLPMPPASPVRVLERKPRMQTTGDITNARVVICVGRGLEKEADLDMARQLAAVLNGEIACTRPISQEMRWLPEDLCIGLSAKKVKPDLYIGLGVSGQIQHLTGIRDARVIVAVNQDPNAPIFSAADYGVSGDLYEVVPLLLNNLEK